MAKKIKRYKVGLDSETYAISMVDMPAIEENFVHLAKQDEMDIKLSSDERHICYGPALIPNKDIYRNNGEQEFYINFTEESIVKMSQDFMKNFRQSEVNLQHAEDVNEVFVCESWLVEDPYRDKANTLGFNVPKNTWMIGMKVNNVDTWERIKAGELKGFSVESAIRLEEFNKNSMDEINETFWTRLSGLLREIFNPTEEVNLVEENLEEQTPIVETPDETSEEVTKPDNETQDETPDNESQDNKQPSDNDKPDNGMTEEESQARSMSDEVKELINNLKEEIAALKEANSGLEEKVKKLGKKPSVKPVNTNANPNGNANAYSAWREQMRKYIS